MTFDLQTDLDSIGNDVGTKENDQYMFCLMNLIFFAESYGLMIYNFPFLELGYDYIEF